MCSSCFLPLFRVLASVQQFRSPLYSPPAVFTPPWCYVKRRSRQNRAPLDLTIQTQGTECIPFSTIAPLFTTPPPNLHLTFTVFPIVIVVIHDQAHLDPPETTRCFVFCCFHYLPCVSLTHTHTHSLFVCAYFSSSSEQCSDNSST